VSNATYFERLAMTIRHLHNRNCEHAESVPVHEVFRGQTVWDGRVEVFSLSGHPKAKKAYAWSHLDGANDEGERIVTVFEIPPVESPETAVRVAIVADAKKGKK
jgi:hypothetical protein